MCEDWATGSEVVNRLGDSMGRRIQSLGGLMGLIGYVPFFSSYGHCRLSQNWINKYVIEKRIGAISTV